MQKYICIHGHFYQPPRENAWLETVEVQDSAQPFHDWNERITAECYGPNAFSRILDPQGRIIRLVNNYSRISFNFGPTLLSWLAENSPRVYAAIIEADRLSRERFSGHGSALAQVYNHVIMPLANRRDKETQVRWGIADFTHRFGREPEGMWLAETAVDLETLDVLAAHGIRFTVLAPYQAKQFREFGAENWEDASGGKIDPSRAYVQKLSSGRSISLFFYDGPLARGVAFERLLHSGAAFVERLHSAFSQERHWPQLAHLATDGESYGHHHAHGDMALAHALQQIDDDPNVALTNYAEFLERHPPTHEVNIVENSSWSCFHGVERWRSDCGCNMGRGWHQAWRTPLREALDWLRDAVVQPYEELASQFVKDPWAARDRYISVVLQRSPEAVQHFTRDLVRRELSHAETITLVKLMELQRNLLLMYTSCGWFFDDISGIETVQIIQYAGRAMQLARTLFDRDLEPGFLNLLETAPSNVLEHRNGRVVYDKFVKSSMISWPDVAAHYAVSTLFEQYSQQLKLFCFTAEQQEFETFEAGKSRLCAGRVQLTSNITREAEQFEFAALHFGDHTVNAGVRPYRAEGDFDALRAELQEAVARVDLPQIIRIMDRGFGESSYSLGSLFRDEQRKVIARLLDATLLDIENTYRKQYEQHLPTMRYLQSLGVPLPRAFQMAIDFVINADLRRAYDDAEINVDRIKDLIGLAETWKAPIDTRTISYHLTKALQKIADRLHESPERLDLLAALTHGAEVVHTFHFEVNLWHAQNVYYDLLQAVYPDTEVRAFQGDENARQWIERFVPLGEKLGVHVEDAKKKIDQLKSAPSVEAIVAEAIASRRIPRATYRLQLHASFKFANAQAIVPYLRELGISECYTSPILQARPGSGHGYDICDHTRLNSELGDQAAFDALTRALKDHKMGLLIDTVPNHMGIGQSGSNPWWTDVLENGPSSIYAGYFDIDWQPVNPNLKNKVLLPILEDQYGIVLESGKIKLAYEEGAFRFHYYDNVLPVEPCSYSIILGHRLDELQTTLGEESGRLQELRSILTALTYLPPTTETAPDRIIERNREKEVIKRRLAGLFRKAPLILRSIERSVAEFNGVPGDRRSFDHLDRLFEAQPYRLAYWRVATDEINYRRFFDINELAAIRVERPEVFRDTHQLTLGLLADGKVTSLRIDHPDGLWDPTTYFRRLQEGYLVERVKRRLPDALTPPDVAQQVARALEAQRSSDSATCRPWPLYVVAEKILGEQEPLPGEWAVSGTTGYDFINTVNGIFVDTTSRDAFDAIYERSVHKPRPFAQLVNHNKKVIMLVSMASEVASLGHQLDLISERNRRCRDFTLNSLTFAIREIIAALPIYRTYINSLEAASQRDRLFIEEAVHLAKAMNPRTAESLFNFVRDTLLLRNLDDFAETDRPLLIDWVMRFQQVTGPVLAKGLEDTTFYVYNRLMSLNEVGGHPESFGISLADFHRQNQERCAAWPHAMLAGSTHDTKRSEDVRARINVLSEMPGEWDAALRRWREMNLPKKTHVDGKLAPDSNDDYLLYQTLLGAWPITPLTAQTMPAFRDRIADYMQKAISEAKVHTSWVNPNNDYNAAVRNFVQRLLPDNMQDPFLQDLQALQSGIALFGAINSLSQLLLRLTSPGVPDIYQGTELWDLSLVDPDNRRPVDYALRRQYLTDIKSRTGKSADLRALCQDLVKHWGDGRIKMYVIYQTLNFRRAHDNLFLGGDYLPVQAEGNKQQHVCAFSRRSDEGQIVVVAPRLIVKLCDKQQRMPLGELWDDTRLVLPESFYDRTLKNTFTGEQVTIDGRGALPLSMILGRFPVACLAST